MYAKRLLGETSEAAKSAGGNLYARAAGPARACASACQLARASQCPCWHVPASTLGHTGQRQPAGSAHVCPPAAVPCPPAADPEVPALSSRIYGHLCRASYVLQEPARPLKEDLATRPPP